MSKPLREFKKYWKNGNLWEHGYYDNEGHLCGEFKKYYSNGQLQSHYFTKNDENGHQVYYGIYLEFREDGKFVHGMDYDRGKRLSTQDYNEMQLKKKIESIIK